jgi:high-affinity nickel-transport protein
VIIGSAASVSVAFVLGLRHGLDADHLAAIDGLTRCHASAKRRLSPFCGLLFSAGHAGVILAAAIVLSMLSGRWAPPEWLASAGTIVSASTLLLLGFMNVRAAFTADDRAAVRPVGLRSRLFASILRAPRSWQVALVGALFAVSFDALAIAALFAASASGLAGVMGTALAFAVGMLAVGIANGFWVVRLLRHSGNASRVAAQVMTLTIGAVALCVSGFVLLSSFHAPLGPWMESYELFISGFVVSLVLAGYFVSLLLACRTPPIPLTLERLHAPHDHLDGR